MRLSFYKFTHYCLQYAFTKLSWKTYYHHNDNLMFFSCSVNISLKHLRTAQSYALIVWDLITFKESSVHDNRNKYKYISIWIMSM